MGMGAMIVLKVAMFLTAIITLRYWATPAF